VVVAAVVPVGAVVGAVVVGRVAVVAAPSFGDDDPQPAATAATMRGSARAVRMTRILAQAPDSLYLFGALRNCSRTKSQPSS
jgi:hypothetical protein